MNLLDFHFKNFFIFNSFLRIIVIIIAATISATTTAPTTINIHIIIQIMN